MLLGPNNSGKSAALSALRLLSQTIESYDRKVPLLLNGKHGDFGTFKDLVFRNSIRRSIGIELAVDNDGRVLHRRSPKRQSVSLTYSFRSARKQIILRSAEFLAEGGQSARFEHSDEADGLHIKQLLGREIEVSLRNELNRRVSFFHFLPNSLWYGSKARSHSEITAKQIKKAEELSVELRPIYTALTTLDYLSALRKAPSRTYAYSGEQHAKVGASGENAMSILAMDALIRGKKSRGLRDGIVNWLSKAGVADAIDVEDLAGRFFELQVRHPRTGAMQNIADVGFGISQVLPVLVGGLNCQSGSTFVVEEPEIHLHPKAQAELGDFFLELKSRNVQSIIETHSEHLILRLLQHVASGALSPSDIVFYSVVGGEDGCSFAKIEVDGKGSFIGGWPSGFFPERLEEARKLAAARAGL